MKQRNKKVGLFTIALVMLMGTFGCKGGKTTTIVNRTDSESQKIQYSGQIVFTKDGAGIEHISDGGYLEFEQNGREFKAEEDKKGHITYAFNGDSKITTLSNEQQAFVATAIKQIVKTKAKL